MINSKFKRTYNIIFVVLTLVTSLPRIGILVGMCVDFLWGPYEKTDKYIGLAGMFLIIATLLMLVGILCLYSGLKYFLFEPEKKPLRIVWNIVKLMGSVLFFMFFLFPYWP